MANINTFKPGDIVVFNGEDHHTFVKGEKMKVHADHNERRSCLIVCDPTDETEPWVIDFADVLIPTPEQLQEQADEKWKEVVIKRANGKRLRVNTENLNNVVEELQRQAAEAVSILKLIDGLFTEK